MAVKGRDLSYEAQEPAFLRRLRAQQAGRGDPDRHERPIARPSRPRGSKASDEDEPTYVDEESNRTLSKEEYEASLSEKHQKVDGNREAAVEEVAASAEDPKNDTTPLATETSKSAPLKQDVTEIGKIQRKRKAGKIIGVGDEEDAAAQLSEKAKPGSKKPKKKAKAVALSFDDG